MLSFPSKNAKNPTDRVYSKQQTRVTANQHIFKTGLKKILITLMLIDMEKIKGYTSYLARQRGN